MSSRHRFGLLFVVGFGSIMTAVGLAQLFAATSPIVRLSPATQSASTNQSKVVKVTLDTQSHLVVGGYIQVNYDSSKLTYTGLDPLSPNRFPIVSQQSSGSTVVFQFETPNEAIGSGVHDIANLKFTTKAGGTAAIGGSGVPYKGRNNNKTYWPASSLSSSIAITAPAAPPSPPAPAVPPSPAPSSPVPPSPPSSDGDSDTGFDDSESVSQTYDEENTDNQDRPDGVQTGQDSDDNDSEGNAEAENSVPAELKEQYAGIPGLFGASVFGAGERAAAKPESSNNLRLILGIILLVGSMVFYFIYPRLSEAALRRETKKPRHHPLPPPPPVVRTKPVEHRTATPHVPAKAPAASTASIPQTTPHAATPPQPAKTAVPQAPATTANDKATKPQPVPPKKPDLVQEASQSAKRVLSTEPLEPVAVSKEVWGDIRRDQAMKIAHGKKDAANEKDLPDMFDLAQAHPESFGSQTLYDTETTPQKAKPA